MADDGDVDLRIRVARARQAQRDVQGVSRAVRDLGDDTEHTNRQAQNASRGVGLMTGAMGLAKGAALGLTGLIGVGGPLLAALPILAAGLTVGAAGFVAMAGAGIFAKLVTDRYEKTSKKAGTAAHALAKATGSFQKELAAISAPAADIVLQSLANALTTLQPALKTLEVPLQVFAGYLGEAIELTATGLVPLFPKLGQVIIALGPLMARLPELILPIVSAFLEMAIVGTELLPSIADALVWVAGAAADAMSWIASFVSGMVNGTGTGGAYVDMLWAIYNAGASVVAVVTDIVNWFKQHEDITIALGAALGTTIGVLTAYRVAVMLSTAATALWTAATAGAGLAAAIARAPLLALALAFAANPVVAIALALGALVGVFVLLYQKAEWFRTAVDAVWAALKVGFQWVTENWPLLLAILTGPFGLAVLFITKHWDQIIEIVKGLPGRISQFASGMWDGLKTGLISVLNWIIDKLNGLTEFTRTGTGSGLIPDLPKIAHIGGEKVPGAAQGGVITRGGAVDVGELGRERLWAPRGAVIQPLPAGGAGEMAVIHTHVILNDTEIATAVHKAATRKASTR